MCSLDNALNERRGREGFPQVALDKNLEVRQVLNLVHKELCEAVPDAVRQLLLPHIRGRVHAAEQSELGVPLHGHVLTVYHMCITCVRNGQT